MSVTDSTDSSTGSPFDWSGPPEQGVFRLPYFGIRGSESNASDNFESFCCDLAVVIEGLPAWTHPYGRRGQRQEGIDIRGETASGAILVVQCKLEKPPASAQGKVDRLKRWVHDYERGHARHGADRLILCAPWPADTAVIDYLSTVATLRRGNPDEQRFGVELWNGPTLDRFASAYPEIVRRYFGNAFALRAESAKAIRRAAAIRIGVDEYFNLASLRVQAESDTCDPASCASLWDKLARNYRSIGFEGKAYEAEHNHVKMLKAAYGDETALSVALTLAMRSLDDLQTTRCQVLLSSFHGYRSDSASARRAAVDQLRKALVGTAAPTTGDGLLSVIGEVVRQDPADARIVPLLLAFGEVELSRRRIDSVKAAAHWLRPMLNDLSGSTHFARVAALLADAGIRSWNPSDIESTTEIGRIILWARKGRRHFFAGQATEAVHAYEQAEVAAVGAALEGPARSTRECIGSIRQWMPTKESIADIFEDINDDRELCWSYDDRFGTFPNSAQYAGDAALAALDSSRHAASHDAWRQASVALLLSVRGGLVNEEFRSHRVLAHFAADGEDWDRAIRHAVLAGDVDLAEAYAVKADDFVDLTVSLGAVIHKEAKAASAALGRLGWLTPLDEVDRTRDLLFENMGRWWGMKPLLPELSVKALATMASFPMTAAEWNRHFALVQGWAPRVSAGSSASEIGAVTRWLYRWSPDSEYSARLDEVVLSACRGEAPDLSVADRRQVYRDVLVDRSRRDPHSAPKLRKEWADMTGEDLWGDEFATAVLAADMEGGQELQALLAVSPNEDPLQRSGYLVPHFTPLNAERWSLDQRLAIIEALLSVAESRLDTWMTRRSALERVADLGTETTFDPVSRASLAGRLVKVAESLRGEPPPRAVIAFDYDQYLWARALPAAAAMATKESVHLLVDPVSELLFSDNSALVSIGADAVNRLAMSRIPIFSSEQLLMHANTGVRRAGVTLAVNSATMRSTTIRRLVRDSDPQVRMSLALQLNRLKEMSCEVGAEAEAALARDRHSLVRWAVADSFTRDLVARRGPSTLD